MYHVDQRDRVVELADVPRSDVGAPLPIVVANEHSVTVAYYLRDDPPDGASPNEWSRAIVRFRHCRAHYMGAPNDEAFSGHPLAGRGLRPYGAFEVLESSWIREMERRNEVHPYHRGGWLQSLRHFVLAFHDSTFECVAEGYRSETFRGGAGPAVLRMVEALDERP
jgi:hypothetical protein